MLSETLANGLLYVGKNHVARSSQLTDQIGNLSIASKGRSRRLPECVRLLDLGCSCDASEQL